jgi:hypothetical protein
LVTATEVDDGQAGVSQTDAVIDVGACIVWPTMAQRLGHALEHVIRYNMIL